MFIEKTPGYKHLAALRPNSIELPASRWLPPNYNPEDQLDWARAPVVSSEDLKSSQAPFTQQHRLKIMLNSRTLQHRPLDSRCNLFAD